MKSKIDEVIQEIKLMPPRRGKSKFLEMLVLYAEKLGYKAKILKPIKEQSNGRPEKSVCRSVYEYRN